MSNYRYHHGQPICTLQWEESQGVYSLKFDTSAFVKYYKTHIKLFFDMLKQMPRDMWEYTGDTGTPNGDGTFQDDARTWYIAEGKLNDVKLLFDFYFNPKVTYKTLQDGSLIGIPFDGKPPVIHKRPPQQDFNGTQRIAAFHTITGDLTILYELFTKAFKTVTVNGCTSAIDLKRKSMNEIKKFYFRAAQQLHPDLHPNDTAYAEAMSRLNEVYTRLKQQGVWK